MNHESRPPTTTAVPPRTWTLTVGVTTITGAGGNCVLAVDDGADYLTVLANAPAATPPRLRSALDRLVADDDLRAAVRSVLHHQGLAVADEDER